MHGLAGAVVGAGAGPRAGVVPPDLALGCAVVVVGDGQASKGPVCRARPDLLWVVATIIVVYAGLFTRGGEVLAAVLAGVVLAMAMLQSIGVRRMGAVRVEVQS